MPEYRLFHPYFFIYNVDSERVESYPRLKIDFSDEDIPENVKLSFEEALTCHSVECYTASAILIRKTLEEICKERGAKGKKLVDQIQDLNSQSILPKKLFDGLNELRLLGNDAAHIELKNYEQISAKEVEVGIKFTKEILKAVYQYKSLLEEMQSLKKSDDVPPVKS